MGIDKQYPLVRINEFNKNYGINNVFLIKDFIKLSNYSYDQDIRFLMNLAKQGFITYNSTLGTVIVLNNVERYIMAKSKKEDYDVIKFESIFPVNNINAKLDLNSMDLTILNVKDISLSEIRDVGVFPNNGEIVIKKGLDFELSGRIEAGKKRFVINSENINFDYQNFKMLFNEARTSIRVQ